MQPKFTLKQRGSFLWLTPVLFFLFSLFAGKINAQPTTVYETTHTGVNGTRITDIGTGMGPASSMGDAIVLAGTNRYVNRVEVRIFTVTGTGPFNLTLRLYTDCSTDGTANSPCGNGPGVLVPNSTITLTGVTAPAPLTAFTVAFNYTSTVNLTAEADNQINLVLNASTDDVAVMVNEAPVIGSTPPTDPAGGQLTRCGSLLANNGCNRQIVGLTNNFDLKILASATPCNPVNATAPTISSVPSSTCAGSPITLSILAGNLNGAAEWRWYSGSCGGTLVGVGNSINVSPVANTTYFARGEGGCAPAPGPCGSQAVTVTACSCLIPDVATICAGSIQKISLSPAALATTTQTFGSGAINLAIPDANPAGVTTAPIVVPAININPANNLRIQIDATHTWVGDTRFTVTSPCGTTFLFDRPGVPPGTFGNDQNLGGVYTFDLSAATIVPEVNSGPTTLPPGSFRPSTSGTGVAHNWAGITFPCAGAGNWTLNVADLAGGDVGTLNSWAILVDVTNTAIFSPTTDLFTDALATVAYTGTPVIAIWAKPTTTRTYTATISGGPCVGANTVTVNVLPVSTVTVTPNIPGGVCAQATLVASGASIYNWSPAAGLNTTTGATVIATPGANTTYTVNGYSANGCAFAPVNVDVKGTSTSAVISSLGGPPTPVYNESWNVVAPLPAGWASQNSSSPVGSTGWFQGNPAVFPAQNGATNAYIGANFNNTTGTNTISNWLFTPVSTLANGDQLVFWTRTTTGNPFPDRLQVRMSTSGASVNVGATSTSTGDFGTLLLDINPTLVVGGYPEVWTMQTAIVTGLGAPVSGRFAFRYFVTNGGPTGDNSNYIGIDNVTYQKPPAATCANNVSTIKVDITGGTSPYTLVYSNGTTNTTFAGYVSGTPIQVSPAVTTTYTIVSVTGANGCVGVNNTGTAVITVTPPPAITAQPVSTTTCVGLNATFTVTATPALGTTYQWEVSTNGGSSYTPLANVAPYSGVTGPTLTITGATAGLNLNRYRVVVSGACPPSPVTSTGATLFVNQPPTIVTQPANVTRCVTDALNTTPATFTVVASTPAGPAAPTYRWQVSTNNGVSFTDIAGAAGAGSTLTLSTITLAMNNNLYQVVVTTAPCAATATSIPARLTVNALPVITIAAPLTQLTPGQNTTITATSIPGALTPSSFSWTRNGVVTGVTSGTTFVNIDSLGTYRATVTDINTCRASSNSLTIGAQVSEKLWIYPNPTDGAFEVRLFYGSQVPDSRVITIYNAAGQMVARKSLELRRTLSPYEKVTFDLSNLAPGVYAVKVTEKNTHKIVSGLLLIQ